MYSQFKVVLDNDACIEVHCGKVLGFDKNRQPLHLTAAQECILKLLAERVNERVTSDDLYKSYSSDDTSWNPKEIRSNVSKLIYTMPDKIREKIDNVRTKGYRLTGQRANVSQVEDINCPIHEKCTLKSTHIQVKSVFIVDKKREQLFEDVDKLFSSGHNAIFIHGLGGIGKSEFAKQYAKRKLDDKTYSTIVFAPIDVKRGNVNLQTLICDDVVFSITNFPKRNESLVLNNSGNVEYQSECIDDYFRRKYAKIREICDKETLIIIDNFDVAYDREIIRFLEGNYHVIITTRYHFPDISCPQIELKYMDHSGLLELFFKNSGRTDISADDPVLVEIFDLLGSHTMAIELFAKYMAEDDMISVTEICSQLQKSGSLANLDGSIQVSSEDDERKPFDYIMALFDIASLQNDRHSEGFKTILSCMCLMPLGGVKKHDFLTWCGIKSAAVLNKLIQRSWIFEDVRDGIPWISMHSVVSEVMRYQFKPDFDNCKSLIQSLHNISDYGYFHTLDEASYISPVLKRILYLCPITKIEHCEIYISFVKYFAIREEAEIAAEILSSLCAYADARDVSDPVFHGLLCEGYGHYFAYLRRNLEAVAWRRKGIAFYQKAGKFPDRILEQKREIIWSYIHQQDIPAALSAATELDTWLNEAPEGTKRQGLMLHLKARLDYAQGHYDSAILYDTKALAIFKALNLHMDCGSAYHVLGLCNSKNAETFDLGINQLKKCLTIWQNYRTESSTSIVDIHRMIADAYFDSNRYHDALLWYQKCMDLLDNQTTEIHSAAIKSKILLQIAECKSKAK